MAVIHRGFRGHHRCTWRGRLNIAASDSRRSVLVVDDEPDILEALSEALELEGYQVSPARNGLAALQVLPEVKPALVLLDLNMPEMDGHEFLRHVRGDPDWTGLPVVVMTAGKVSSPGADGFLQKPCDVAEVLRYVAQFCRDR